MLCSEHYFSLRCSRDDAVCRSAVQCSIGLLSGSSQSGTKWPEGAVRDLPAATIGRRSVNYLWQLVPAAPPITLQQHSSQHQRRQLPRENSESRTKE